MREREERERLRREREEKERQREREREREEKLKKEQQEREKEKERKEKEKREQEMRERERERERMLQQQQQQRMNEVKPNTMVMHDGRSQMMRNGIDGDVRIKEENRKEEDYYARSDLRYGPGTPTSLMNPPPPTHSLLTPKHPSHLMPPAPPHPLNRSMIQPPPGSGMPGAPTLSHYPPHPPPPWGSIDPYRDPFRMDAMSSLRYNPIMEAIRMDEERAKAYAAHSSMHFRQKDQPPFTVLHHRMPPTSIKPPTGPMMPSVGLDGHTKKEDSLPPQNNR